MGIADDVGETAQTLPTEGVVRRPLDDIFGSPWFRLIVDRYRFRSKTSDTTRALGEPGDVTDVSVAFQSDDTRPISHIEREYFGRLDHLDAVNPASGIPVTLSWNTDRQMIGAHEWWHWGTEQIPRKGVYGWVNPVQLDNGVRLGVILGTDSAGEALFERLFLRSKMSGSDPVVIYAGIKTLPIQDTQIGLISEYTIEHGWRS